MVIDDDVSILDLFKKFFILDGVNVQVVPNPRHAVFWYKEHWKQIELVFLDMKNPSMSGEDCFRILRVINPQVHIALISGNVEADIVEELMQEGALRFFPKPFHYPTVISWALRRLGLPVRIASAYQPC
jgi:DNA-binding NtrC family response regulator